MSGFRPVDQTRTGEPHGNCFAACVASILGLPLEAVDFDGSADWWNRADAALRKIGWAYFEAKVAEGWEAIVPRGAYYIASGMSPRGIKHAVVHRDGQMVHDPNPARAGILSVEEIGFLVPMEPWVVVSREQSAA